MCNDIKFQDRINNTSDDLFESREKNVRAIVDNFSQEKNKENKLFMYIYLNQVAHWIKAQNEGEPLEKIEDLNNTLVDIENDKRLCELFNKSDPDYSEEIPDEKIVNHIMSGHTITTSKPKSTSDNQAKNKKNETDINYPFISAIAIRVLAIVAFFTAYSFWNNLVLSISMIFAMLIPFVGGAFCHFFLLCLPFIAAFSPNYELSQSIILLIVFALYIPCLLCFLYSSFIFKFDSRKKIISVMAIVLSAAAVFLGVMQFNKPNQIVSSSVPATTIKLNDISSYVSPGDTAHISVTAKPNTEYSISVEYSSGYSEAEGLENKTTDSAGRVSWSWKVGTNTYSGEYPITITNHETLMEYETFYFTVK